MVCEYREGVLSVMGEKCMTRSREARQGKEGSNLTWTHCSWSRFLCDG